MKGKAGRASEQMQSILTVEDYQKEFPVYSQWALDKKNHQAGSYGVAAEIKTEATCKKVEKRMEYIKFEKAKKEVKKEEKDYQKEVDMQARELRPFRNSFSFKKLSSCEKKATFKATTLFAHNMNNGFT